MKDEFLPSATRLLWRQLENEEAWRGFILVGGSALSIRIGHRLSEDLDFAFPAMKLPSGQLAALRRKFPGWTANDNPAAYDEFLNAGMSLHDFQQDYLTEQMSKSPFSLKIEMRGIC
jgi:hypothetical protein